MKPVEFTYEGKEVHVASVKCSQRSHARFGARGSKRRTLVPHCDHGTGLILSSSVKLFECWVIKIYFR